MPWFVSVQKERVTIFFFRQHMLLAAYTCSKEQRHPKANHTRNFYKQRNAPLPLPHYRISIHETTEHDEQRET